jgi:hypothetical protein
MGDLDGHAAIEILIDTKEYRPEATITQLVENGVATDLRGN